MRKNIFILLLCLMASCWGFSQNNIIEPELQTLLNHRSDDYIDVNIMFKSQMTSDDFAVLNCKSDGKEVRREIVINELKKFAEKSQRDVMSVINAEERSNSVIDIKSYWIANFINCKAKADVIYKLASHPDVALITYNSDMDIVSNTVSETDSRAVAATSDIYPHLTQIKADKVWELGYTGKGVVVAVLDSGTNLNHDDIKDHLWNENGKYGYNVHSPNSLPSDEGSNGHGSHCAGIVCGDGTSGKKTGVAPDAKLMTIKIVGGGRCTAANLVEGVQKAADLGADVISLSIGRENPDENRALFRQTFTSLLQTGIAAAVAAGNDGNSSTNPAPDNVRTPGDCPPPWIHPDQQGNAGGLTSVISVGAVNEYNVVSPSSSKGPVTWQSISGYNDYPYNPGIGLIRPDIAAPGENVYSIRHDATNTYWGKSGTSQAAPCVAGVMALMLEKNPELTPADLCRIIETTAVELTATKSNSTGAGLIDALAAVQAVNFNDPVVINPYAFTSTLNAGSNINLELTLINNGSSSTSGTTSVTISENDNYTTIVQGSKIYSAMAADATASATFVVNIDPLVEDNHVVTFTVTATNGGYRRTFNIDVNVSNEFVAPVVNATANGTNVNLTWDATNNATSYNIYRDGAYLDNTTSTSYTDAGLEYGTVYAYTITSKRGDLESEQSLVTRVQTGDNPETPSPTDVIANNGNITWTNATGSKGSNIYRKDYLAGSETSVATNVNETSYTDNNWNSLEDGIYQYGVSNLYVQNETVYTQNFTDLYLTNSTGVYPTMNAYWYIYREASGNSYNWEIDDYITNVGKIYESFSENAAFIISNYSNSSYLSYLVTRPMDYTQYNGKDVKLSFKYIIPAWGNDINTLKVMISTTSYNSGWTELWSSNKTDVQGWPEQVVDLSAYVGQQFYIAFVNVAGYGYCTGVDEVSVIVENSSESRIEWSESVGKNVNMFVQDGNWSNTNNWSAKRLPKENENVIINADATIASGNVEVNSLTINEGKSLTLNSGTKLTVIGDFTNTDADAFIINDGAQVFLNNDNVAATFNMNIIAPDEWSYENINGWQFISSPMKNAKIESYVPTSFNYDLYRYVGNNDLEWLNHKDGADVNGEFETEFLQGIGYLASFESEDVAAFKGIVRHEKSCEFDIVYDDYKDLANFHLLGNPFTFDMDWSKVSASGLAGGYAVVNENGGYDYLSTGTIKVGDGFFVKALSEDASLSYNGNLTKRGETVNEEVKFINVIVSDDNGKDNVVINLSGDDCNDFPKITNINKNIANVYVPCDGKRYGVYYCNKDTEEVSVNFESKKMGRYTISAEFEGDFDCVVLFDRFTGIETNLLLDDYKFAATNNGDHSRFVLRLTNSQQPTADSQFVYQSGEELVVTAKGSLQIIDIMGRMVYKKDMVNINDRIDLSKFNKTAYIVRLINEDGVNTQKVVIY